MFEFALLAALITGKPIAPACPPNVPRQPATPSTVIVTGPNGQELHLQVDDKYANVGYFFGLFGAVITAASFVLSVRQVKLAEKQTALSQAAAELARQSAAASNESARAARESIEVSKKNVRALVTVTPAPNNFSRISYPEGTAGGKLEIAGINSFTLVLENQGSTPARLGKQCSAMRKSTTWKQRQAFNIRSGRLIYKENFYLMGRKRSTKLLSSLARLIQSPFISLHTGCAQDFFCVERT